MLTACVMQPYFASYVGYYRLLAACDLFVLFDCVQFPRRGWVHRNRLPDATGEPQWLTLPLKGAAYEASIASLDFADDAAGLMAERTRPFPSLSGLNEKADRFLHAAPFEGGLVDYLEAQITTARDLFGFDCRLIRSSSLAIDPALRAQDRILAILKTVGATDYVNPPGGRDLYDAAAFADQGVTLSFLPDYPGPTLSLLHRLATEPVDAVRGEILSAL